MTSTEGMDGMANQRFCFRFRPRAPNAFSASPPKEIKCSPAPTDAFLRHQAFHGIARI